MPSFSAELAQHFRTHCGIAGRQTLLALGLSPSTIKTLLRSGELVRSHEGVYRSAAWPDDLLSQCAAMCAADDRVVVCCGGAAQLWQYRRCTDVGVHLTTTATGRTFAGQVVVHRCSVMPPGHIHHRPDGIRVTSPARSVFDLSRHLSPLDLESVIEQGLRRRQFDMPTLYEVGRLLCRPGRGGSELFARVIGSRPAWRRPTDSHPELALLIELRRHGVHLQTQVALRLPNGHTIHPDLGDPNTGFYIEVDDHEWHGGRLAATYDVGRDRQIRLSGARIERVSTDEISIMAPDMVVQLVTAYHQQQRAFARRSA
jgi:hypothetical protein